MKNTKEVREFIRNYRNVSGVYAIVCDKTWRSYVGSSCKLGRRIDSHFVQLKGNKHSNKDLQEDFKQYGLGSFYVEILELCDEYSLLELETKWYKIGYNLYNKTPNCSHNSLKELSIKDFHRFWLKIDVRGTNDCWNWKRASLDKDGYARFSVYINGKRKAFRSNRVAYFWYNPYDDENLIVRHKCNNPTCCNYNHLELGSYSDNKKDINNTKGTKFNKEQIKLIRDKFNKEPNIHHTDLQKWTINEIGIEYPSLQLINICINKTYYDKNYTPLNRDSLIYKVS